MKYITLLLLLFLLVGCTPTNEETKTLAELIDEINIPDQIDDDLNLPLTYTIDDKQITATWTSSNPNILTNDGKVTRGIEDQQVTLTLFLSGMDDEAYEIYEITVLGIGIENFINNALDTLDIPTSTKESLTLNSSIYFEGKIVTLSWVSSNQEAMDHEGNVGLITADANTTLTVTAKYDNEIITRNYQVKVIAFTNQEQVDYIFSTINLMPTVTQSINLPTEFPFGRTGTWESDAPDIINHNGEIIAEIAANERRTVTFTLTLNTNETGTYEVDLVNTNHMIIDREFNGTKTNLEIENEKLVLVDNQTEGYYQSNIYETFPFTELVASWAALSSTTATVEVEVAVRVDGEWSDYISYGKWGYGLENRSPNDNTKALFYKNQDEIFIRNNKTADALKFKVTLRRNAVTNESPVLSLIAATLLIKDYEYQVQKSDAKQKDYDVPKLRQNDVPVIGGSICSPTSATMLLQYKGIDFSEYTTDQYPHRYFAGIITEHASGIYGNWVYNTIGMSAYGFDSYVKRMYSTEELLDHLDNIGPVAASVKGIMIGEIGKTWTTNGHLIVVRGYRYEQDQLYIIANDPNMSGVYEEYKVENFLKVWRNIIYVIE